jgi:Mg2+/Co2+ transporter CorB
MLESKGRIALAVVNEMGETIGAMLHDDILDMVFTTRATRSERLFNRQPIVPAGPGEWDVTGMSNLRALEQHFGVELPETSSVTIGGILQECLQRLPVPGDHCLWGPFEMEVLETPANEPVLVRLRRASAAEDET